MRLAEDLTLASAAPAQMPGRRPRIVVGTVRAGPFLQSIATGVAMTDAAFDYKGKKIVISDDHPHAVVTVDGRQFRCHHHHPKEDQGLAMWMCEEAYFASPDIRELARHFADYGYMFDDPGRVLVDESGEVLDRGGGPPHDDTDPSAPPHGPGQDHSADGGH